MTDPNDEFLESVANAASEIGSWMAEDGTYILRFTVKHLNKREMTVQDISLTKEVDKTLLN